MDDTDQPVEELLVLRVVSEAQRRRARRAVVAGLLLVVASGGVAIGLTHRSGAEPTAQSSLRSHPTPMLTTLGSTDRAVGTATRAEILAVARARYAVPRHSGGTVKAHIEFDHLAVTGDRATLQVNFVCAALCGHGEELTFAERDGSWRVIGVRTTWVS